MKRLLFTTALAAAMAATVFMSSHHATAASEATAAPYRHVVLFKFKDDAPKEKVDEVLKAFAALKTKLPSVLSFEHGTNVSPEGLDQGFTHVFTATFKDKASLENHYLKEPAHVEFVGLLKPVLDKVLVVDYYAH
jgi:hypothetical protein